jgi:WD40 repeat protein
VANFAHTDFQIVYVGPYGSGTADSSDSLRVIETPNGNVLVRLTEQGIGVLRNVAPSPDGRWGVNVGRNLSTGAPVYNVTLLEVGSGRVISETLGCQSPPDPARIAFSPDSSMLAVALMFPLEFSHTCNRLIDSANGAERARFEGAMSIAFSPDSRWLATGGRAVQLIDTASGAVLTRVEHDGRVDGVAFSPDGTLLATVSTVKTAPTLQSTVRLLRVNP